MTDTLTLLAPAKVNLYLHVAPVMADGYHPLDSLVAFADVGDRITVSHAPSFSFEVVGPFAQGIGEDADNLVVRALLALASHLGRDDLPLAMTLDKRLPVAAGLGGGSSDAGAALRAANMLLELGLGDEVLERVARSVGADGPMCYRAQPAYASGVGEVLEPADLPALHAVLVNPGLPSPTGAVYRAFDRNPSGRADRPQPPASTSSVDVIAWLAEQRNDLEAPALSETPAIGSVIEALSDLETCRMVRMSGSGATVFGLFEDQAAALDAAFALERDGWWVRPTVLGAPALVLG
ncbi:4-(cytidine 5'-diphospho)-2-C-methyl-D-erythritol kinase [Brevundimonas pishanensis]|uniref:4-(cytidine 5'-diphospho)-2-C-methyl-D-erythritol kinase n=1 Tax=Brevundimonas pishanensis TaxID=2896315 RepID=UPI001FA7A3FA|nr:4-(cytidine 5'-diphospho)-2-C-methyl-D-erythritol kinase [Brevundimonas pishanensis]